MIIVLTVFSVSSTGDNDRCQKERKMKIHHHQKIKLTSTRGG
jgi:hypothetical protein